MTDSGSADSHYYDWVDQFDTLGLGKNTPIVTGNYSDSLIALSTEIRDHARALSARLLRERHGWPNRRPEGRLESKGVWTTWGTRTPFHQRTGRGPCKVVHFQIQPQSIGQLNPIYDYSYNLRVHIDG